MATAANKACLARSRGTMKTRSVNTEVGGNNCTRLSFSQSRYSVQILFNMSSSSNISDSLNKFGVGDAGTDMLVVGVNKDIEDAKQTVVGDWVDVGLLGEYLDSKALTKLHKLKPDELSDLTGSLCSRIAAKDCL